MYEGDGMSDIKFNCTHCNQHLEAEETMAGLTVPCPLCNKPLVVPHPSPVPIDNLFHKHSLGHDLSPEDFEQLVMLGNPVVDLLSAIIRDDKGQTTVYGGEGGGQVYANERQPYETTWYPQTRDAARSLLRIDTAVAIQALFRDVNSCDKIKKEWQHCTDEMTSLALHHREVLIAFLDSEESSVVHLAIVILSKMRERGAVGQLCKALNNKDSQVRAEAAIALGEIKDEGAVESLCQVLRVEGEAAKRPALGLLDAVEQAVIALGKIGNPSAVGPLHGILNAPLNLGRVNLRSFAFAALKQLGDPGIIAPLLSELSGAFECHHWSKIAEIADVLGGIGDESAVEPLKRTLEKLEYYGRDDREYRAKAGRAYLKLRAKYSPSGTIKGWLADSDGKGQRGRTVRVLLPSGDGDSNFAEEESGKDGMFEILNVPVTDQQPYYLSVGRSGLSYFNRCDDDQNIGCVERVKVAAGEITDVGKVVLSV
jgi:hypothetical protein